MPKKHFIKRPELSRLEGAAIASAVLLSLACLARGVVYDGVTAIVLLASLLIMLVAATCNYPIHTPLKRLGAIVFGCVLLTILVQQLWPAFGDTSTLWQGVQTQTGQDTRQIALQDHPSWFRGVGCMLWFAMTFITALHIGSSEASARMFLQALLVSGTACLAFTFFTATSQGMPASFYSHGFINANNAAAYLGIMLLLALLESVRFFSLPTKPFHKIFLDIIDHLSMSVIFKGGFLLFALLLALAGLFMTGSRAGIVLAVLFATGFLIMIVLKTNLKSRTRKWIFLVGTALLVGLLVWTFINFGEIIAAKLRTDGVDSNSRYDIIASVLPMIADHPLLGAGLGSFPSAFQQYRPQSVSPDGIIDKAHNTYLEFTAEMGIPTAIILMAGLVYLAVILYQGICNRKERYATPALGLSVWLLMASYSLVDFPLQIPAIAALCIAIVTVCAAQSDRQYTQLDTRVLPRKRIRVRKKRANA